MDAPSLQGKGNARETKGFAALACDDGISHLLRASMGLPCARRSRLLCPEGKASSAAVQTHAGRKTQRGCAAGCGQAKRGVRGALWEPRGSYGVLEMADGASAR